MTLRWVYTWKALSVKARLVALGFTENVEDKDDIYVATPVWTIFTVLIVLGLTFGWVFQFGGVSTTFLHAAMTGDVCVWHPQEYYGDGSILWKLKKQLYGLRGAPRGWQDHISSVLVELGFDRLKSE